MNQATRRGSSLATRTVIIILAVLLGYILICFLTLRYVLFSNIAEMEQRVAQREALQCQRALANETDRIRINCKDWAFWDDSFAYLGGTYPDFAEKNLPITTFEILQLNLIAYVDLDQRIAWAQTVKLTEVDGELVAKETHCPVVTAEAWPYPDLAFDFTDPSASILGITETEHGPMIVAGLPILTSDQTGPSRGALYMGRLLDSGTLGKLSMLAGDEFTILEAPPDFITVEQDGAVHRLASGQRYWITHTDSRMMRAIVELPVIGASHEYYIDASMPRLGQAEGNRALGYAILAVTLGGLLLSAVAVLMLRIMVTGPVSMLAYDIHKLEQIEQPTAVIKYGPGEIGFLAGEFSRVFHSLAETRRQLEEKSKEYSHILQNIGEGIIVTAHSPNDDDMLIIFANPTAEKLFGVTSGELVGQSLRRFVPADQQEVFQGELAKRQQHESNTYEMEIVRRNGERRSVVISASPRLSDAGDYIGSFSILFDITDRVAQEKQMRLTQFSVDRAPDSAFWLNADGDIIYVNDAACKSTGYTREELLAMSILDIDRNFSPADWRELWARSVVSTKPIIETTHTGKDGTQIPVEITANHVEFGGQIYNCTFARDITQRKQAEEELKASEERFRLALVDSPLPIMIHAEDGEVVQLSRRWTELSGYDDSALATLADWVHRAFGAQAGLELAEYAKLFATGQRYEGVREIITAGGEVLRWEFSSALIGRLPDGRRLAISTAMDVTARERLEQQLRQSQKMEALGVLAGGIAHDFNNMLFAILGNADLAADAIPSGDPAHVSLREIITATQRATELVRQILAFARQSERTRQQVDVVPLAQEAVRLVRATLPANIEIEQHYHLESAPVLADPSEIHQVLMNLCTNSGQEMLEHGGRLSIDVGAYAVTADTEAPPASLAPGDYVLITVSDTGRGIPAEMRDRIFEPFFTTKGVGQGTGMGLAVVHGIIADLQGAITVESPPGLGARFSIYIPRSSAATAVEPPHVEHLPTGTERVLMIDDEEAIGRVVNHVLTGLGYTVETHDNPAEALACYRSSEEGYDLVITDQSMPHLTGAELARQILAERPEQKIMLCTGYSQVMPEERALAQGISAYLLKPLDRATLATKVREVLDRGQTPAGV
ncbi:PAS domain S-box protein [bacterium]|nr:PAS domain S-box protein [bacterium]